MGNTDSKLTFDGGTLLATDDIADMTRATTLNTDGGAFEVDANKTLTHVGVINGAGGLSKTVAGKLTLTGANTYSSATHIKAGSVAMNGSSDSSDYLVYDNAILNGTGSAGSLQKLAGGVIAPGNSIGTFHVVGNHVHNGTMDAEVNFANKTADKIIVGGELSGNGQIKIIPEDTVTVAQANAHIDLMVAANDTNASDDNFTIATAQRYNNNSMQAIINNSPNIWELSVDNAKGRTWYLGAPTPMQPAPVKPTPVKPAPTVAVLRPELPMLTSLPTIGKELAGANVAQLHTRLGELCNNLPTQSSFDAQPTTVWLRANGGATDFSEKSSFELYHGIKLGADYRIDNNSSWTYAVGAAVVVHRSSWDTSGKGATISSPDSANADVHGWSLGAY